MKVDTLKGALVEALADWFPCCAAAHQCAQMSVPVSPHGRGSNQKFSTRGARYVAEKLMSSQFPCFLNDLLEVSKSRKWLVGVLTGWWSLGMDRSPRLTFT